MHKGYVHMINGINFIGCLRTEQSRTETQVNKLVMPEEPKAMKKVTKIKKYYAK